MSSPGGAEIALRRGLLLVVALAAVTAVLAGLARVGVPTGWGLRHAPAHGPLFALAVFGTVIALERAVALGRAWAYVAAGLGAAGAISLLADLPASGWLATASALALCGVNVAIIQRQTAAFTLLMLLGSVLLAIGCAAWALDQPIFRVAPTWIGFFVLTIAAERLELSRLAPTPRWAHGLLVVLSVALVAAAVGALFDAVVAPRAFGVLIAAVGVWELRFDLARRTIRAAGLPRFAASGVLLGAGWLCLAGAILARHRLLVVGPIYDAAQHPALVGFVLSMVFAHAPIILPAVARIAVPYHAALFIPLALLHAGLVLRVVGDLAGVPTARQAGAVVNALSLALFAVALFYARLRAR